ncbi:MAG: 4'-phosphopantetheinyl transferase superfamily protein [Planctomycetota bacterium]|nr:4'-phosphopantetheinyl transferase superfamily protein [Planctomycetota bacterium]
MSTAPSTWVPASLRPPLPAGRVHVWRARLSAHLPALNLLASSLSAAEHERAGRFRFEADRDKFIIRRGLLRRVLSRYIETSPDRLAYAFGPNGKPALATKTNDLEFNQSSSGDMTLVAVARSRPLGVDVERIKADGANLNLARRFFAPGEIEALNRLGSTERTQAFFRCWTRKEAFVKALGEGLSMPLDNFEVSLLPGRSQVAKVLRGEPEAGPPWELHDLRADPAYADALCTRGPIEGIDLFDV